MPFPLFLAKRLNTKLLLPPICPLQCRPTVSSLTYLQTAKEFCPQEKRRNQYNPHHNPFSAPNPPLLSNAAKIPKFIIIPLSPFLLPFPPGASSIKTRRRRKSRTNTCRRFFYAALRIAWKRVFFRRRRQMHEGRGDGGRKSTSKLQLRRLLLLLLLRRGSV